MGSRIEDQEWAGPGSARRSAKRRIVARLGVAILLLCLTGPAAADSADSAGPKPDTWTKELAAGLRVAALRGARVGVLVVDAADGRVLFEHHADRPLIPASNQKILTAIAALRVFGPAHRFTTRVFAPAAPDSAGRVGGLHVLGGGDPGLTSEDLWRLAADLHLAGLRRVDGDLWIDDSLFDGERWHTSWHPVSARAYHAPVGAFTANYGAFAVRVEAGGASGAPVKVSVDPPVDFLRVVNRARTAARGSRRALVVDRRAAPATEEVVVGGSWPLGGDRVFYRSVLDPAAYAASVLRLQLQGLGIPVTGKTRRAYVPDGAFELLAFEGRPLADVVMRFLKYSSNPTGEALVKSLAAAESGVPGSWEAGVVVVRRELEAMGLPTDGLVLRDGSGLSYENRVSPRLLVAALRAGSRNFDFGPEFVAGLPIGGTDGTLRKRAERAGRGVRAKTGLLNNVTGLSGFARRADGSRLAFSILVNDFRSSDEAAMGAVDDLAAVLVGAAQDEGS